VYLRLRQVTFVLEDSKNSDAQVDRSQQETNAIMHFSIRILKMFLLSVALIPLCGCGARAVFASGSGSGLVIELSQSPIKMSSTGTASLVVTAKPVSGVQVASGAKGCGVSIKSGLPSGITASWSQPTVSSSGYVQWSLDLTGSKVVHVSAATLQLGAYVTDKATGATYTQSQNVPLAVALVAPTLTFSAAQTSLSIVQGTSATDVLSFTTGGSFSGNVTVAATGLPAGVKVQWSSNPINMSSSAGATTMTLGPSIGVAAGQYPFTLTATGDGLSISHAYTLSVAKTAGIKVAAPSALTISSTGSGATGIAVTTLPGVTTQAGGAGCTSAVVSGLPAGVTATFTKPTTLSSSSMQFRLTFTGSPQALGGNATVNFSVSLTDATTGIVFTANQSVALTVKFVAPTLVYAPAATSVVVQEGSSVSDAFTFTGGGSYYGPLTLSVSGLPSGLAAGWSQNPVAMAADAGGSILTLTASTTVPARGYSFTVTATGDGISVSRSYTAKVEPISGVSVAVSQSSLRVVPGVASTLTVTAQAMNTVTVAANASGVQAQVTSQLPEGITAQWGQPTITHSGTVVAWPLTLNSTASVLSDTIPVTVTPTLTDQASGMSFSANGQFSLIVSLLAQVSVGTTPGATVPSNFLGLSHEWSMLNRYMGNSTIGVNQTYRTLLNNLTEYGSDPLVIRVGGNSTDLTGASSAWTDLDLVNLATASHNSFILGVNLGSDSASLAVSQAQNDVNVMPAGSIAAIEIGNEPDLYYRNGLRASTYTFSDYQTDFETWAAAVDPVLPSGVQLAGPAWSNPNQLTNLPAFLTSEAPVVSMVTQHWYAVAPSNNPPGDVLLEPSMSKNGAIAVATGVAEAHASGKKFRIDELGSIDDSGIQGVGNAFQSALWAVDTMFEFANVGVDGVNFEASGQNYVYPFYFTTTATGNTQTYQIAAITPLYYGMLLFQQATQHGASLLPVTLDTTANLKCWPTVDSTGTYRLTLLNKDENQSGTVAVTMPGFSVATITWLTAPSYTSTSGVTLGGQTFDTSTDGTIQGTASTQTVEGTNGVFTIQMPVTSAALVVFSN